MLYAILMLFLFVCICQSNKKSRWLQKYQVSRISHQQGFEIQHVFFAQDDEGSCATERVAPVGLQTRHSAETTLPVLTTGDGRRRLWNAQWNNSLAYGQMEAQNIFFIIQLQKLWGWWWGCTWGSSWSCPQTVSEWGCLSEMLQKLHNKRSCKNADVGEQEVYSYT